MNTFSGYLNIVTIAFLFVILTSALYAQPWPGDQWIERAYAYADYYWNGRNPDYGDYSSDCVHFTSQIANAGCAGMCETNNTNWPEWTQGNCVAYRHYGGYDDHCTDCNGSEYHEIQKYAGWQSWWFYDNTWDWPDYIVNVTSLYDVPDWVGPGVFFFARLINPDGWHAMFIDAGQGPNARYWALTNDRHDYPIANIFNWSRFCWAEFYGSGESPDAILVEDNFLTETEQEGNAK
jgi:hypothetical protein